MIQIGSPLMLSLAALSLPGFYLAFRSDDRYKKIVSLTKALTLILVAIAASSPSIMTQEQLRDEAKAVILEDASRSMKAIEDVKFKLEGVEVSRVQIASGNNSDLRSSLLEKVEKNRVYLLESDLRSSSSLSGVAETIRSRNSTVHLLKSGEKTEASVRIEGPDKTYPGADNSYTVKVSSTGEVPEPVVRVNGEKAELEKKGESSWVLDRSFSEKGYYRMEASVDMQDRFRSNNHYFKAVKVTEKPEVLVIGERGRIEQEMSEFYSFTYRDKLPENLDKYYAVIAKKKIPESELSSYVTEGNGLIYTGSYDEQNHLLPVRKQSSSEASDAAKTILVIDNSREIGSEGGRSRSIKMSAAVVEGLNTGNKVGLVYYNSTSTLPARGNAGILSYPKPVSYAKNDLLSHIAGLQPDGIPFHGAGLEAARKLIGEDEGNIILITDGNLPTGRERGSFKDTYGYRIQQNSFDVAENLDSNLIIIGIGASQQDAPGGDEFLRELARKSGGQYYRARDILRNGESINLVGGGGSSESTLITVVSPGHFITRGLELESYIKRYDSVRPKPGARELVKMGNGNPFLTTWRYGIGRVAAFSGGTEDLGRIMFRDSDLVSRTMSWSVGEPERKENKWMNVENGRMDETVNVRSSDDKPGLARQSDTLYTGEIKPDSTGFHSFGEAVYSYSYNPEIEKIGYDDAEKFARSTGGHSFSPGEKQKIKQAVKQFNSQKVKKQKGLSKFFLAAALLVFLGEVGYRKRNGKK
ncbi:MAG: hypothetical protein ABEJ56_04720 [Candidatus Nanohaloarchaea archaeon]